MQSEHFIQLVEEVLESIPTEFRERIHNLAVLVEDRPKAAQEDAGMRRTYRSHQAPPPASWSVPTVCPLLRRACSTSARDRTASSFTRKISRRSAGMKQKSVMRSGRPFSTNWDTTLGWMKLSLRTFSSLRVNEGRTRSVVSFYFDQNSKRRSSHGCWKDPQIHVSSGECEDWLRVR